MTNGPRSQSNSKTQQYIEAIGTDSPAIRSLLESAGASFFTAAIAMGANPAIQLFTDRALKDIENSAGFFNFLCSGSMPFCSLNHLETNIENFILYQLDNKDSIIATGSPRTLFGPCDWLYNHLACMYPDCEPSSAVHPDSWLSVEEIAELRQKRSELFDTKVDCLRILANAIKQESADTLWQTFADYLKGRLSAIDIHLYLKADVLHPKFLDDSAWDITVNMPGGLANIFAVAYNVEAELRVGTMAKTHHILADALREMSGRDYSGIYYDLIAAAGTSRIDEAETTYCRLYEEERDFQEVFIKRLSAFTNDMSVNLASVGQRGPHVLKEIRDFLDVYSEWLAWYQPSPRPYHETATVDATDKAFYESENYRVVSINGFKIELTPLQAELVRILHKASLSRRSQLTWPTIETEFQLGETGFTPNKMYDVLRGLSEEKKNALINTTKKGLYKLNI